MEEWSDGVLEYWEDLRMLVSSVSTIHYSNIPILQYSNTPILPYFFFSFNAASTFSGVMGRSLILTPTAS